MAKRPDLTNTQRKIVDRYYQHQDSIYATKLAELVTSIALADSDSQRDKLWKSAESYLAKCGIGAAVIARIVPARDAAFLAQIAGDVAAGKPPRQA